MSQHIQIYNKRFQGNNNTNSKEDDNSLDCKGRKERSSKIVWNTRLYKFLQAKSNEPLFQSRFFFRPSSSSTRNV